jgi:peptidoglycan/LPS O-acetylase OafA/YrhL
MTQQMNATTPTVTHETNLDFVRAFAMLLVVSSYLWYFFGNIQVSLFQPTTLGQLGAVGVLIFVVHSGIVNTLSIERPVQKHGSYRLFRVL